MRSPAPSDGTGAGWCSSRGGGVANVTACCRVAATWKGMLVSACLCVWLLSRVGRLRLSPGTLRDAPWSGCSAAAQGRGASGDWCGGEESAAIAQGMQGCDVQMRSSGPDEKTARLGLLFNYDPDHTQEYTPPCTKRQHTRQHRGRDSVPPDRQRYNSPSHVALNSMSRASAPAIPPSHSRLSWQSTPTVPCVGRRVSQLSFAR